MNISDIEFIYEYIRSHFGSSPPLAQAGIHAGACNEADGDLVVLQPMHRVFFVPPGKA